MQWGPQVAQFRRDHQLGLALVDCHFARRQHENEFRVAPSVLMMTHCSKNNSDNDAGILKLTVIWKKMVDSLHFMFLREESDSY